MALTQKELNEFKLELNDLNDKMVRASKKVIIAKAKLTDHSITKEEVQQKIAKYNETKANYKKAANAKKFLDNYNDLIKKMSTISKTDSNFFEIKKETQFAKNLYKEAKWTIKERGKTAHLSKLNNIALKINHLKFKYSDEFPWAVNDVSVSIEHGEYVAIIGHNGSGKSTLSKIIIGVLQPQEGAMEVFGNHVTESNLSLIRRFLGIVFQNPDNQFIGSTVRDDIAFGLENRRIEPSLMEDKIITAAKKVRMEKFLDNEPLMLSGGQKQRVAIASALALSPDIIIFDEATSMLDPKGKREVKEIMIELRETREKTIFSITHDMDEILNADKVMVMNMGELVKFGTPSEILSDKNFLRSIHLEIPFVALVEEELSNVGINIEPSKTIDELVNKLCK
ncbi:energy-coupling factor transporter ATPase [Spiroplasma endosymbiont of Labia minor]|uniref:energy-coupling factor transporter ATPase n=1 Tax=Spiroplasma endosymbiont of Labia minor TaxID=3066305 RepID=UPI0030CAB3DB